MREHSGAVEASLQAAYHVDLRDVWRPGRKLTWRRLYTLVRHLPADSPLAVATGEPGWRTGDYLLADVVGVLAGEPHPADPRQKRKGPPREAVDRAKARAAARRRRLGMTGSVLRPAEQVDAGRVRDRGHA